MKVTRLLAAVIGTSALLVTGAAPATASATQTTGVTSRSAETAAHPHEKTLRQAATKGLRVGTAVAGGGHHEEQDYPDPFFHDHAYRGVLAKHFNSLTPENQLKWEFVHPERHKYNFAAADAIVNFARKNGQTVRGHTLLWHSQNPAWLTEGNFSRKELRAILREHILTVVGRYRGKIHQWDVANEIIDDNGNFRTEENIWLRELGPEIIADAFRWAHQADPKAKLFLNDYGAEGINPRSDAYLRLAKELRAKGVPVHGFAVQAHLSMNYPFPSDMAANLKRFQDAGFETAVTELDVRMTLPESGEPTQEQLKTQADYYRWALEACLSVKGCKSFTLWGTTNRYSWVPVFFPSEGHATVFWDDFRPKPAYYALRDTLLKARGKH